MKVQISVAVVFPAALLAGCGTSSVLVTTPAPTPPLQSQTITFANPGDHVVGNTFTLTATASSGLSVSFSSKTASICTVSGATATLITAGSCTLEAAQSGDATYAAASPVDRTFAVKDPTPAPLPQTITFANPGDHLVGATIALNATASSGLSVSFSSKTTSICTVSASTATLLTAGSCTIEARQPGNTTYAAATPVDRTFAVNNPTPAPLPQAITFANPGDHVVGSTITLSATASSGLPVTFSSKSTATCAVSGSSATLLATGSCTIEARQPGNATYAAASPVDQTFAVTNPTTGPVPQTITFPNPGGHLVGDSVALTATASSGLAVSFSSETTAICTVAGSTATLLGAGSCTIQARQPGDDTYAAATPVDQTFSVQKQSQTITFSNPGDHSVGDAVPLSATASSGLSVTFSSKTTTVCAVSGSTATLLAAGSCTLEARQGGNATYAAATPVDQTFSVQKQSQTIIFSNPGDHAQGDTVALTATASSGLSVTFSSKTTGICTVSGSTAILLATGSCTLEARQAGNASYAAATSVDQTFSVKPQSQTITFANPGEHTVGDTVPLTATASSGLPVSFSSKTTTICMVSGSTASLLAGGSCTIEARQAGNPTYAAATPVDQTFTIQQQSETITFANPGDHVMGDTVPLTATASSGLPVTFSSKTSGICTVSGSTASLLAGGSCTIQAMQPGNATYAAANPVDQTFSVKQQSQTITFDNPGDHLAGGVFTLRATASSGLPVTFSSNTTGTCTVSGSTATLLAGGSCTIRALQSGNASYAAASPVDQTFTVANPVPAVSNYMPRFVLAGSTQSVTISGMRFVPTITATLAGAPVPITFVNSGTVALPLTASDLPSGGMQTITLQNPPPGGGSVSIPLPVLAHTGQMIPNSQTAYGDQARLQRVVQKARAGSPLTIATLGGSITQGVGASDPRHSYASILQSWFHTTFPSSNVTLVNAGIGATASDYGALRASRDVLAFNPDLVVVEFAVNDGPKGQPTYGDTYEGLIRQLLDAPSHPAVLLLFMMTYQTPIAQSTDTAQGWQQPIGANYDLPMVSYYDAVAPELLNGDLAASDLSRDGIHPSDLGHAYAALFLEANLQHAIDSFQPGDPLEDISPTASVLHSDDFEFVSLQDGIGSLGTPLAPTANTGWSPAQKGADPDFGYSPEGLQASLPGSSLDFTVTGREILLGYWRSIGPMGIVQVSVDGGAPVTVDACRPASQTSGYHAFTRVADALAPGSHQVHITLTSNQDSNCTATEFRVLSLGTGGDN